MYEMTNSKNKKTKKKKCYVKENKNYKNYTNTPTYTNKLKIVHKPKQMNETIPKNKIILLGKTITGFVTFIDKQIFCTLILKFVEVFNNDHKC